MTAPAPMKRRQAPLVVHIINHLIVGGLENGLVNMINHMPRDRYRHGIVCLTYYSDFRNRIEDPDVPVIALHKRPGKDLAVYTRLMEVLKSLRPDIVHTRNLASLACLIPAAWARVSPRVHGEHGRDVFDLDGSSFKYNLLRRLVKPLVTCYTAVSEDLARWLVESIGVRKDRVKLIHNGVDTARFRPRGAGRDWQGPGGFLPDRAVVVGTVGRMQTVKDQLTLARAFLHLIQSEPSARQRLRLVMIGSGPLRDEAERLLSEAGAADLAWLPGERADVSDVLRNMDVFVLPSLREGLSNTILEAMASGLPVVATRVGGNPELVEEGRTGQLVPPSEPAAMAAAIGFYLSHPEQMRMHGGAGRKRVETTFSMESMLQRYMAVYDGVLASQRLRIAS